MIMAAGQVLDGQYEVLSTISEGAESLVYRAKDKLTGLSCIVKVFKTGDNKQALERFHQEAHKLRRLDHPVIVRFHTYGATPAGEPYLVVDEVQGRSLEEALKEAGGHFSVRKALRLFLQMCDGIGSAHHLGVYHRNLKPSKILVVGETQDDIAIKIIDFGVAEVLRSDYTHIANLTKPGSTVPSPHYMSPEQCMARAIDGRADIYAFGCIMYETLTGQKPINGKNAIEVLARHINQSPSSFRDVAPQVAVSPELEKIVFRCLEKSPEDRFSSVSELRRAVENFEERGTAGAAVSHVQIPAGKTDSSAHSKKEPSKQKESKLREHSAGAPPPPPPAVTETTTTRSEQFGDPASTLAEPSSGSETGKMRRPRPTNMELTTKKSNPVPILVVAGVLALGAVGAAMLSKPGGEPAPQTRSLETMPSTDFYSIVNSGLPADVKELIDKESANVTQGEQSKASAEDRIKNAIAKTEKALGSDAIEVQWLKLRLSDALFINNLYGNAEKLAKGAALVLKDAFAGKPVWLEARLRGNMIADSLIQGKIRSAIEDLTYVDEGTALGPDNKFDSLVAQINEHGEGYAQLVSAAEPPDIEVEEKLQSTLTTASSLRTHGYQLKLVTLWYMLMFALSKKDNDDEIAGLLSNIEQVTKSHPKSFDSVGYMLYLSAEHAKKLQRSNVIPWIDELAVKRFQFTDEQDLMYIHYKSSNPKLQISAAKASNASTGNGP